MADAEITGRIIMRTIRRLVIVAAAAAALAASSAAAVTATASPAVTHRAGHEARTAELTVSRIPDSVGGCVSSLVHPGHASIIVRTCAYIDGSGDDVKYMNMHACVYGTPGIWVREVIYGPHSAGYLPIPGRIVFRSNSHCTPLLSSYPGFFQGRLKPGNYDFVTWWYNSSNSVTAVNVVVLTIH
jgi:hypothetical protein